MKQFILSNAKLQNTETEIQKLLNNAQIQINDFDDFDTNALNVFKDADIAHPNEHTAFSQAIFNAISIVHGSHSDNKDLIEKLKTAYKDTVIDAIENNEVTEELKNSIAYAVTTEANAAELNSLELMEFSLKTYPHTLLEVGNDNAAFKYIDELIDRNSCQGIKTEFEKSTSKELLETRHGLENAFSKKIPDLVENFGALGTIKRINEFTREPYKRVTRGAFGTHAFYESNEAIDLSQTAGNSFRRQVQHPQLYAAIDTVKSALRFG